MTVSWNDGVNSPGGLSDSVYTEEVIVGVLQVGYAGTIGGGIAASNPLTIPNPFEALLANLSGQAGTVKYSFYATDGRTRVGSELCSVTATVAAAPVSTTTTTVEPTTLPHTGSNTSSMLAGGAMIVAFGGALYLSGRRRSVK